VNACWVFVSQQPCSGEGWGKTWQTSPEKKKTLPRKFIKIQNYQEPDMTEMVKRERERDENS